MRFNAERWSPLRRPRMPAIPHIEPRLSETREEQGSATRAAIRGDRAGGRGSAAPPGSGGSSCGASLPCEQDARVIVAQKASESRTLVARFALRRGLQPSPKHGETPEGIWLLIDSQQRARSHIEESGPHEILTVTVAHSSDIQTLLTRPHGPQ